jgi:hypothetical protein
MSTVESIDKYFSIRGIQDNVHLVSDSQDIDSLASYVDRSVLSEYGCFFEVIGDAEITLIYGCTTSTPWSTSRVELIYSAAQLHARIKRQNRKPVSPANDLSWLID